MSGYDEKSSFSLTNVETQDDQSGTPKSATIEDFEDVMLSDLRHFLESMKWEAKAVKWQEELLGMDLMGMSSR